MIDYLDIYQIKCSTHRVEGQLDAITYELAAGQQNVLQIINLLSTLNILAQAAQADLLREAERYRRTRTGHRLKGRLRAYRYGA